MRSISDAMGSCVYNTAICCKLPAMCGGIPEQCKTCGWNPAVEEARKRERRVFGKIFTRPKKAEGGGKT